MANNDFVLVQVEALQPGDVLDMGTYDGVDELGPGQGPNTLNVRLAGGLHYTETQGAQVRVWEGPSYDARLQALADVLVTLQREGHVDLTGADATPAYARRIQRAARQAGFAVRWRNLGRGLAGKGFITIVSDGPL